MLEFHRKYGHSDDSPVEPPENGYILGSCRGYSDGFWVNGYECWLGPRSVSAAGA